MGDEGGEDKTVDILGEAEAVANAGRHGDDGRWADRVNDALKDCVSGPAFNVQYLKETLVPVRLDFPVMQAAARRNRFAMQPKLRRIAFVFTV